MHRSLMAFVLLLFAVPALAGCLGGDEGGQPPFEEEHPVAGLDDGTDPAGLPPYSLQLCDQGYRLVQAWDDDGILPGDRSCDFRVTKPLVDGTAFEWIDQHGPANEVSMAVNPTDPLNLVGGAKDYTPSYIDDQALCGAYTVWNGHFTSLDGGRTWNNDLIPGFPGDERDSPLRGNFCNTDPVSVFDSDGTYWHNGLNYRGAREDVGDPAAPEGSDGVLSGSQIFFARSQDKGATFDRITTASFGDNNGIFNDKNWLAVDPDSDHMIHTWTNFYGGAGGVIEYVESFDGGASWTAPAPMPVGVTLGGVTGGVTGVTPTAAFVQFSMPQYDSAGNVWVIWTALQGPAITHAERPDPMAPSAFQPPQTTVNYPEGGLSDDPDGCLAKTGFRASVYPVLALDTSGGPHNDRKYIAYPANGATGAGIWVTHSDDAVTWSDPIEVTAELPDDQFMSWIDVGSNGDVHVTYYDCSAAGTGADGDRNMTLGYTFSLDGGETWSTPIHVGEVPFDGDDGHHQSGAPFIGDYLAVDASDKAVHFFWADARHAGETGRMPRADGEIAGSDVYAATILRSWDDATLYAPELA